MHPKGRCCWEYSGSHSSPERDSTTNSMNLHAQAVRRRRTAARVQHGAHTNAGKSTSPVTRTATKRSLVFGAVALVLCVTLPSSLAARSLRQAESTAVSEAASQTAPAPKTVRFNLPPDVITSDVPLEIPAETIQAAFRGSPAPAVPASSPRPVPAPAPLLTSRPAPAPAPVPTSAPELEQNMLTIPSASGGAPVVLTTGAPGAPGPSVITIPGQQQQQSLGFKSAWHPLLGGKVAPPQVKVITPPATVPQQVAAAATPAPQQVLAAATPAPQAVAAATATAIGSGGLSIVTSNPISISTPVTTFNPVKTWNKNLPNVLSVPAIDGDKMLKAGAGLLKVGAAMAQGLHPLLG